jgi:hypothetical protein
VVVLIGLAALAALAYAPALTQPLIQDDYPNIEMARIYGPASGWSEMLANPVFRYRATFFLMTYWIDRLSGSSAAAFYAAAIALHILCTWLVFALGTWRVVGWRVAATAAAFFAVQEGHQEAVMWYSATAELLQFLFGIAALFCWVRFVEKRAGWRWYGAALGCFLLALLSKESAVILAPLLLVPVWISGRRQWALAAWLPFAAMAAVDIALIFAARDHSFRFQDGSFSPWAPFYLTLAVSYGRLLWIWGLLAIAALVVLRARQHRQLVRMAAVWIPIALLPYCFLTYMHRVPSRQTYLASLGLAWIVGAGFWALHSRLHLHRKAVALTLIGVVVTANVGYLWTKKRRQFMERAAPTEALVALARRVNGPIYMSCGVRPAEQYSYEAAVRLRTPGSKLVWGTAGPAGAARFCWEKRP